MLRRLLPALAAVALLAPAATAQLRVVTYNLSDTSAGDFAVGATPDRRTAITTVLSGIGAESVNGIARPLDILLIQESRGAASTGQTFVDILNGVYGAGSYARGMVNGATTGNGTSSIVYRTATVNLVAETALNIISGTTGAAREPLRHQVRLAGYPAGDVYFYNAHFKSADNGTDRGRRADEATRIRADADALGAGVRAVYAGDFNLYSATEAAYSALLAGGSGRAVDPALTTANWTTDTLANRRLHTQSPVTVALYPGEATGGMDDRFDFQLPTANMDPTTGRGVRQVGGSTRVFGNNGTHAFNGPLTAGSQPANVLTALRQSSEHLPVVVDYTLPARLTASVSGATQRVIRGQSAPVTLSVTNSAPVAVAAGADVLDYAFGGTGAVTQGSGSASGLAVFAAANAHVLSVPTSVAGVVSGTVTATATSPQAATAYLPVAVTVTALDPSRGSLDNAALVTTRAVGFGSVTVGNSDTRMLAVYNLIGPTSAALTADLRYLSLVEANPGGPLTAVLAPTSPDLAAGAGNWTLTVQFSGGTAGDYSDTLTINLSDENILGAAGQTLTVTVTGSFVPVPEPGVVAFLLAAAGGVGFARRRSAASS